MKNLPKHILSCLFVIVFLSISVIAQEKKENKLFKKDTVYTIHIQFNQCDFDDSLLSYKSEKKYLQANISIGKKKLHASGIRYKGESSYEFYPGRKKSFKIKFNAFVKGQNYKGNTVVNLNNCFKDPSFLREKLYFDFMKSEGVPCPGINFAQVYINGVDYGLYALVEEINKRFLKRNFGSSKGNLIKGEPQAFYTNKGNSAQLYIRDYKLKDTIGISASLLNFIQTVHPIPPLNEKTYYKQLKEHIDIEKLIKTWAITNLFVNIDAYNMMLPHNHYLFYQKKVNLFHWIPYDGNYAFCAWSPSLNLKQAENFPIFYTLEKYDLGFLKTAYSNAHFRKDYLSYLKKTLKKSFTHDYFYKRIDNLALLIRKHVYTDTLKMYNNEDFEKNLKSVIGDACDPGAFSPGLLDFVKSRRESVLMQIDTLK